MKLPDGVSSLVYRDDDGREIVRKLQPEWIPVSERLPEAGKQYLCCDVNGFIEVGYLSKTLGEWGFLDNEAFGEVIAWMPLPEPYREDGEMNDK